MGSDRSTSDMIFSRPPCTYTYTFCLFLYVGGFLWAASSQAPDRDLLLTPRGQGHGMIRVEAQGGDDDIPGAYILTLCPGYEAEAEDILIEYIETTDASDEAPEWHASVRHAIKANQST